VFAGSAAAFWGWTDDPYIGNYGDNSLLYFHQYQNAPAGTPLANKAKTGTNINSPMINRDPERLMDIFRDDVRNGRLPKVSWIVAPEAYSEHPNWEPDFGTWYLSQVIDILASNPEVWSKMALFVTYDEEGGFFDHLVPPVPPQTRAHGLSTVEITNEIFPGDGSHPPGPYGLGIRVPMLIVSPWTRGGWVNSELFDHTSMIRFLETRFARHRLDLIESNITPWRRAVVGDLTSAFDFKTPNASRRINLPDTEAFKPEILVRHDDEVPVPPVNEKLPKQEHGVRPARAIAYTLHAHGALNESDGSFRIQFRNSGEAGAVFQMRSGNAADVPRTYTLEPDKQLTDSWSVASAAAATYDLSVHGPNGFFRGFKGAVSGRGRANIDVRASYDERDNQITLEIANRGSHGTKVTVSSAYKTRSIDLHLGQGDTDRKTWSLTRTSGWYD
jgi:phospholipase C